MILFFLVACGPTEAVLPDQSVVEYACEPTLEEGGVVEAWEALGVPLDRPILVYGVSSTAGWYVPRSFYPIEDGIRVERSGQDMDSCLVYGF